jgi:uncharacterized protein (DUF427 family)
MLLAVADEDHPIERRLQGASHDRRRGLVGAVVPFPAYSVSQDMWSYTGKKRPPFAVFPHEGQESVWDYPRPPSARPDPREVIVRAGGVEIARTTSSVRVLETASPPTFYLPPHEVRMDLLTAASGASICEWKGRARYWTLTVGDARIERVAWSYSDPLPAFEAIRDYMAFYPSRVECFVAGIRVEPQPGRFYGGWITPEVVGPFKGEPGTEGW